MATPSDSPIEEVVYEIEPSRVPKPIPVALEDLCRLTKFTRQEIRIMYRGFKTVSIDEQSSNTCPQIASFSDKSNVFNHFEYFKYKWYILI